MAGTKEIKRRIISVKNTKKITKAMELVAASKMKRAVSATLASRLYADYSHELLKSISENLDESTHPFFNEQKRQRVSMVCMKKKKQNVVLLIMTTYWNIWSGSYRFHQMPKIVFASDIYMF
jgi:ATP synthase F1 gamma subunit